MNNPGTVYLNKHYEIKIPVMFGWRTKFCGFPLGTGWSCWQHVNIDTIHRTFYTFFLSLHSYTNFTYIKKYFDHLPNFTQN